MTKFIHPFATSTITDDFDKHVARNSANPGTDYAVKFGTPVPVVADGVVTAIKATRSGAAGRFVIVNHGDVQTEYLHLSAIRVKPGQKVTQGTIIGASGGSGFGKEKHYGAHLHLTASRGGSPLNRKGNFDFEKVAVVATATPAKPAPAKPAPAKPAPVVARREVKIGSKGDAVKMLQKKLGLTIDGVFGKATKAAVVKFQKKHDLLADGIVGAKTWAKLG
jgi:murein DD-endopeptidase MepM/ murein hydrolase activator NlpD